MKKAIRTEEFLDPDYPRRQTTIAWAEAAGFEPAERYGTWLLYTLNFRKPERGVSTERSAAVIA
ncbi:MAG: hypothetical protein ACP5JG_15615 [Anaerolineae bacterium]